MVEETHGQVAPFDASAHLPECLVPWIRECICTELRACEERIRAEERAGESARLIAAAENGARLALKDAADCVRKLWPIHQSISGDHGGQLAAEIEALQPDVEP